MQKKEMKLHVYLFVFIMTSSFAFAAPSNHLLTLKSKFPYGLLTDDYGILTVNDLAINACYFEPRPLSSDSFAAYEYWQCFDSKKLSVECVRGDVPDENEGVLGLVVVNTFLGPIKHQYIERRLWPIRECRHFTKDLKELLKGTAHACISGSYIEKEEKKGRKEIAWLFERMKTVNGCEGRGCEFTRKIQREECPDFQYTF
jgi:hypothetical protein